MLFFVLHFVAFFGLRSGFFFCCTFLMISLVFVSTSCDSGQLFFYVQFFAISCIFSLFALCSSHICKPQFSPLRAPARVVSLNCLLPDAPSARSHVFHGFPTASGPDKKITASAPLSITPGSISTDVTHARRGAGAASESAFPICRYALTVPPLLRPSRIQALFLLSGHPV